MQNISGYRSNHYDVTSVDIANSSHYISHSEAQTLITRIDSVRKKIFSSSECVEISISSSCQHPVLVRKDEFHILLENIGEGSESVVFKDLCFRCGNLALVALKEYKTLRKPEDKQAYEKEIHLRDRLGTENAALIDLALTTFRCQGRDYAVHKLYSSSLWDVNLTEHLMPAGYMLKLITRAVEGLAALHDAGFIVRDFKGGNILVEGDNAVLTDLATAVNDDGKRRMPQGSFPWYDPAIFRSLIDQKHGDPEALALQTKSTDMYAVGKTVFKDILYPLFLDRAQYSLEGETILSIIAPTQDEHRCSKKGFTKKRLQAISDHYEGRAIFLHKGTFPDVNPNNELILGIASAETQRDCYTRALDFIRDKMPRQEVQAIEALITAGYGALSTGWRFTAKQFIDELMDTGLVEPRQKAESTENTPITPVSSPQKILKPKRPRSPPLNNRTNLVEDNFQDIIDMFVSQELNEITSDLGSLSVAVSSSPHKKRRLDSPPALAKF